MPLYPIVDPKNKPGEVNDAADSPLAFFIENGLDLYISGHQHVFYPARKNGFSLLNAGAIGEGDRKIMSNNENAAKAYTIIKVPVNSPKLFTYTTYDPVLDKMNNPAVLPDSVTGFNGTVIPLENSSLQPDVAEHLILNLSRIYYRKAPVLND